MTESFDILLAEKDAFLLEMLGSVLRLHNESFEVATANSVDAALKFTARKKPKLIIAARSLGVNSEGIDFLEELNRKHINIPLVVLTDSEQDTAELRQTIRANAFISKPPDLDLLLRSIDKAIELAESRIQGIRLESFLQVLQVDRKTCTLTIDYGTERGRLYLRDGSLIHAECKGLTGKHAVMKVLSWQDYVIKVSEHCPAPKTINESMDFILMEWSIAKDHAEGRN